MVHARSCKVKGAGETKPIPPSFFKRLSPKDTSRFSTQIGATVFRTRTTGAGGVISKIRVMPTRTPESQVRGRLADR